MYLNLVCYSFRYNAMTHLDGLNPQQYEAVTTTEGPLLVLAGAGSGKTRVITHRILKLIENGVSPHNILAVTFTNKAAREMRDRVTELISTHASGSRAHADSRPTISTFHALGVRIIREHHRVFDLKRHFVIYDRSDSNKAIKKALEAANYSPKQFEPRKVLGVISRAKGDALGRTEFSQHAGTYFERVAAEVWQHYERILKEEHALDFDDLLLKTLTLLRHHPEIRSLYQDRFCYIHIDEYQDTNKVQYEIARLLADADNEEAPRNICVVGDIDQNIYSWRGADINNILQFEKHFANAKVILLEENYRSTQTIIDVSNAIIEKNRSRVPKKVFTKNHRGEQITLYAAYNESDEASFIASSAEGLIRKGAAPSEIAVLFRTNFQSRALEEAFLGQGVPYQLLGVRFFERKEIKDALSFLRLALNPESVADLSRIINVPKRGIGKVTLLKIVEGRREELVGATKEKVARFDEMMMDIAKYVKTHRMSQTIKYIMKRTKLEEELKEGGEEGQERLENLQELVTLATRYDVYEPEEAVERLLEDAALQSDQDELSAQSDNENSVKLMTVHAAKGLEFSYVFISGLEEGLFPHERFGDDGVDEEEERRLFYVALTRAQKKVFLTFTGVRTIFGSQRVNVPSSFLGDISDEHLESANPTEHETGRIIEIE